MSLGEIVEPHVRPAGGAARDVAVPADLVAQRPLAVRDASRLLCVRRRAMDGFLTAVFRDLPERLRPGDLLVRNVTRVLAARFALHKPSTGLCGELLLVEPASSGGWWALLRPARRFAPGTAAELADGTPVEVQDAGPDGMRRVAFPSGCDVPALAARSGTMPLPPYVRRAADAGDRDAYQTVYARDPGSVAAPTAGLHFTPAVLAACAARGIEIADCILHVGPGTFLPLRARDPAQHVMHAERFAVPCDTWERIQQARASGRRVVAVGTTVVRALESVALHAAGAAGSDVEIEAGTGAFAGRTRLFVRPPFEFRVVDALVTNFHQPESTLLLLVQAFAGRDTIRAAYAHAVAARYRFFSYGDAMLLA